MSEKRRHQRFVVEGVHGTMVFATRVEIINLSLGGVALRADRRLNIGSEYSLTLEKERRDVDLKGVVVWSTLSGLRHAESGETAPEYSAGLKFKGVFTPALEGLLQFLDDNKVFQEQRLSGLRFQIDEPERAILNSPEDYKVRLISRSGMLIETEQPLDQEHVYPMEIVLPGHSPIAFKGRVASYLEVLDAAPKHYEIGIEFVEMADDDAQRLDAFLGSLPRPA